jgi:hypothetical protein
MAHLLETAVVTDASGRPVDLSALRRPAPADELGAIDESEDSDDSDDSDESDEDYGESAAAVVGEAGDPDDADAPVRS